MDSINYGNLKSINGNQGAIRIPQSYVENAGEYEDHFLHELESLNSYWSINNSDTKSRIFIGPNEDDDDRYKFFVVCAENRINALIERVREIEEHFERPEEFENEAVSMAIQQHGLRKTDTQNISYGYDCENSLNNTDVKLASLKEADNSSDTQTTSVLNSTKENNEHETKKHEDCSIAEIIDGSKEGFDVDDLYFLNKAVDVAIEQKGLCSSTFGVLK